MFISNDKCNDKVVIDMFFYKVIRRQFNYYGYHPPFRPVKFIYFSSVFIQLWDRALIKGKMSEKRHDITRAGGGGGQTFVCHTKTNISHERLRAAVRRCEHSANLSSKYRTSSICVED